MAASSTAYCTVEDVCSAFPSFQNTSPGSVQDSEIQGWIDDRKAQIRSAFLTRGFDPDAPPNNGGVLTTDQRNFLRALNRDGAVADLLDSLQTTVTLQPGEASLGAERRKNYMRVLGEISKAGHDALFNPGPLGNTARHQDVTPLFQGVAGAEEQADQTPPVLQQNRRFWKNWEP